MKYSKLRFVAPLLCMATSGIAQYTAQILPTSTGQGWALGAGGNQIVGTDFAGSLLWTGPDYDYVHLGADGFDSWGLEGVGGGKQIGTGRLNDRSHALMWSGSTGSLVDLHPNGYLSTFGRATDGISQVGDRAVLQGGNISHALLWRDTPESVVDLHPDGYQSSIAYGVWGDTQVGMVDNQPVVWSGTAESMVLLPLPKGALGGAQAIHADEIVGSSSGTALRWDANTLEMASLGPGIAVDTNGKQQVGSGQAHAVVWSGTAESRLDLGQFLPGVFIESRATGIDENGTIVGWGIDSEFAFRPLVWTPVPEPGSLTAFAIGLTVVGLLRHRWGRAECLLHRISRF
ncbi:MAG: hypothetical protein H0W86_05545 [Armatimonadetes bacterium]|nr:hypothetical protein [Armatimonadota bacterium]